MATGEKQELRTLRRKIRIKYKYEKVHLFTPSFVILHFSLSKKGFQS
jgi:hypothetical protein